MIEACTLGVLAVFELPITGKRDEEDVGVLGVVADSASKLEAVDLR